MLLTYIDKDGARAQGEATNGFLLTLAQSESGHLVRRIGKWNEAVERELFERTLYANYLTKRAARRAKGQAIAFDTDPDDVPRSRQQLFAREPNGEYVAVAYQAAWAGWKLARGV